MRVTQAFRYELAPHRTARVALAKHVGTARFAYNWGLERCLRALREGRRVPTAMELHREWNIWKRQHAPWWVEVSKCAPQEALRDLERAFRNWRQGRGGTPRFKRKKSLDDNKARFTGSIRSGCSPGPCSCRASEGCVQRSGRKSSWRCLRPAEPVSSRPRSPAKPIGGS